jgi:hypothetical protein
MRAILVVALLAFVALSAAMKNTPECMTCIRQCRVARNSYVSCVGQCAGKCQLLDSFKVQPMSEKTRKDCMCAAMYAPVCDRATGQKYSNDCTARCSGVTNAEPCEDSLTSPVNRSPAKQPRRKFLAGQGICGCPVVFMPVCNSAGKKYPSACLAKCLGENGAVQSCPK